MRKDLLENCNGEAEKGLGRPSITKIVCNKEGGCSCIITTRVCKRSWGTEKQGGPS